MTALSTWVDATPFRAHLRFLMAVGSLSVSDVAAFAGISSRAAEHLLEGRGGRAVRRISPEMAGRLISVTGTDVRGLPWRLVPADRARCQRDRLRRAGCSDVEIAQLAGSTVVDVAELNRAHHCSELLTIRLLAAARAWDAQVTSRRRASVLAAAA